MARYRKNNRQQQQKAKAAARLREARARAAKRANRAARDAMLSSDIVWYVLFIRSGKEFIAQKMLGQRGTLSYLPLKTKWRKVNRYIQGKTKIYYPAIAGCLFVGFERGQERWFDVFQSINSVYGVLGVGGQPIALPGARLNEFVNYNRKRFDASSEEQFMRTHGEFKIGDQVEIMEGPFQGQIVEVLEIKGRKASILISIFGYTQDADIFLEDLAKVA